MYATGLRLKSPINYGRCRPRVIVLRNSFYLSSRTGYQQHLYDFMSGSLIEVWFASRSSIKDVQNHVHCVIPYFLPAMTVIFDLWIPPTSHSIHISPVGSSTLKLWNVIALLSCITIEAEIFRLSGCHHGIIISGYVDLLGNENYLLTIYFMC